MKKRILAMLLVLVMAIGLLAACNNNDTPPVDDTPPPVDDRENNEENIAGGYEGAEGRVGEIGMFDPDYDYFANPTFRIQYIVLQASGLHDTFDRAFTHWATLANVEYLGMIEFGGDADQFMTMLPTLAESVDGVVLDPDQQMYNRIAEVMASVGTPWITGMAVPMDMEVEGFPLLAPYAGFDQDFIGRQFPPHIIAGAQRLWPEIPLSEFGFIIVDHSTVFALNQRANGARAALAEDFPEFVEGVNLFTADTSIANWDVETSNNVVTTVLSMNPHIENWLVFGLVDMQAQGAALALDAFGFTDTSYVSAFGGEGARLMWDEGQSSAWRSAGTSATMVFGEPIFFALYAFMSGQATPETLWPEWVNCANGEVFPSRLIPFFWVNQDNYAQVYAWGDVYAGSDLFPQYSREGITRDQFSARVAVPAFYRRNTPGCQFCAAAAEVA